MSGAPGASAPQGLPAFGALAAQEQDRLYLFDHGFIFTSPWVLTESTDRHASVLLLTADGAALKLRVGTQELTLPCVAIAPRVMRALDARHSMLISLHVEPSHPLFASFAALQGNGLCQIDRARFDPMNEALRDCFKGRQTLVQAQQLFDHLLHAARPELPEVPARDPRVVALFQRLDHGPDTSLDTLAQGLGLSYHRLSHLFSQEVGLPLKSYQLWRKVKRAVLHFNKGLSLTEIAHEVGFSDSAHLARTFQHFFGIKPSYLDSNCVQVFY